MNFRRENFKKLIVAKMMKITDCSVQVESQQHHQLLHTFNYIKVDDDELSHLCVKSQEPTTLVVESCRVCVDEVAAGWNDVMSSSFATSLLFSSQLEEQTRNSSVTPQHKKCVFELPGNFLIAVKPTKKNLRAKT